MEKMISKASYSRKKREIEIVTDRHFEVNEIKATTDKEGVMERQLLYCESLFEG